MNLNHSVNIIIYSVTAKEFRSEMVHFLQALLYCIIGKPLNPADLPYTHDDGTVLTRLRHLRHDLFKCCRVKMRSNSNNTTDSSGLQHTTIPGGELTSHRSSDCSKMLKRHRSERNGKTKYSITFNSETSTKRTSHRLIVKLQADPTSSVYEHEDTSFHGLSISTED
jgi:hypothetical protein